MVFVNSLYIFLVCETIYNFIWLYIVKQQRNTNKIIYGFTYWKKWNFEKYWNRMKNIEIEWNKMKYENIEIWYY